MRGVCTSPWGSLVGTCWDTKNAVIIWGSSAGALGSKKGWLWCPISSGYGNGDDVLICINTYFLIQRVLKPWWPWTYQNSTVKSASTKVVLTSRKVWFEIAKSGQYCVVRSGSLQECVLKPWWPWTYQNSIVKQASDRVVPGLVTILCHWGWVVTLWDHWANVKRKKIETISQIL
jgi:hypothetical protein